MNKILTLGIISLTLLGCASSTLETRKYRLKPEFLRSELNGCSSQVQTNDDKLFVDISQTQQPRSMEEGLAHFLMMAGATMPQGSSIQIDTNSYTMTVVNTPSNLDLTERILVPLDEGWIIQRIK